ncbi:MAG: cation transporter [Bacteroidetes bacterium GWF2_33_16]|nr:MAG: cation transporter [Bacteroidetes bacterium GWE2_32_14]OFY06943.1 MAG: cation transporter [Bacteroidetes bacterium GWF2_33_16]
MRPHIIIRYIGLIFLFNSFFLFVSLLISLYNNDSGIFPLLYSSIIAFIFGIFPLIYVPTPKDITTKEGFLIVVLSWLFTCLLGMVPYVIWGGEFTFTNAWFESVSGFTTTGSTILVDIEVLPRGLLFWRSATHWIGGIGIIIFALVVLPNIGHIRAILIKNEFSSLAQHNFIQNTKQVLRVLVIVYLGLTLLETIALRLAGMSLFDAVCHSFGTIATGGFSTKNLSIAHYNSPTIDIIVIIFMFLSGIHFGLLFYTVIGNKYNVFRSGVVKFYFFSTLIGVLLVTLNLYFNNYFSFFGSLRYAAFQLVSLSTTTGFANADSSIWPSFSIMLLLFFTLQCACAGSTAGGIKVDRIFILLKALKIQVKKFHHPNAVMVLKVDNKSVNPEAVNNAILYIVLYILIVFISALLLTALGVDTLSAFSGSAATMGNVGPGFNMVYSLGSYSAIPMAGKWILSANMLLGRLEIYALVSLLYYRSWR